MVSLSQSQLWEQSLLCHFFSLQKWSVFLNELHNNRQHYECKVLKQKNVTCSVSYVTCHISRVTCHLSPINNANSHIHRSPLANSSTLKSRLVHQRRTKINICFLLKPKKTTKPSENKTVFQFVNISNMLFNQLIQCKYWTENITKCILGYH